MRFSIGAALGALSFAATPALACNIPNIGDEVFCGHYRAGPKTTFYKAADGTIAPFEQYDGLPALLSSLPSDDDMRNAADWGLAHAPNSRIEAERHNVEIPVYIVAIKPGEDDRDLHVIVSDQPSGPDRVFMNVEVSGLPRNGVDQIDFGRVRREIREVVPQVDGHAGNYIRVQRPPSVVIQGSLFFDGDHRAGCGNCPGPSYAKPTTVWEIHPVYRITLTQ